MTNCKCKTFFGSVAEMNGLESRVVFLLQPVNLQGQVCTQTKRNWLFSLCSALVALSILIGACVLVWAPGFKLLDALFGFSSLLFLSIALFVADIVGLRERAHQAWSKIIRGPPKKTQTVLLTLSHYLAVTRSTCGVFFFSTQCM